MFADASNKVTPVDIIDDRKAVAKGLDIIYEARDLSLPQAQRDGFSQPRADLKLTKARFAESVKRIKSDVPVAIKKAYWTEAREQLRRQVGYLRFDINTLADQKDKAGKKAVLALKKDLVANLEATDLAIRKKDGAKAEAAFAKAVASLDKVAAAL